MAGGGVGPDLGGTGGRTPEGRRRRREAMDAARARSAGRTREEIAALIVEEYSRRGIDPPVVPYLDVAVDAIVDGTGPAVKAQTTGEVVASLARGGFRLVRWLKDNAGEQRGGVTPPAGSQGTAGAEDVAADEAEDGRHAHPHYDGDRHDLVAVELDPAAAAVIAERASRSWFRVRGITTVPVDLRPRPDGGPADGLVVEIEGAAVGRIGRAGAARFSPVFAGEHPTQLPGRPPPAVLHAHGIYLAPRDDRPASLHVPAPRRYPARGEFPPSLRERLEPDLARYFVSHCVVCTRPVDLVRDPRAYVTRGAADGGRGPFAATTMVTVHAGCDDRGRHQAVDEGLRWDDAPPLQQELDLDDGP